MRAGVKRKEVLVCPVSVASHVEKKVNVISKDVVNGLTIASNL